MSGIRAACTPVVEESQIGAARRQSLLLAAALGFDDTARGKVGIIVTEAAANLVRHATEGVLVCQPFFDGADCAIDVVAVDRGPGMRDPGRCLADGYSTGGTAGQGLGAIQRMSHEFDIDSHVGRGTVVAARLWRGAPPSAGTGFAVGGLALPLPGETACGDAWSAVRDGPVLRVAVVDGLGHGEEAATASSRAVAVFRARASHSPAQVVDAAHAELRTTRGAAMAVVELRAGTVRFAGVGNIAASVIDAGRSRSMVSVNGIVGYQMSHAQEFTYPWPADGLLVLASDGLRTQWRLDEYPGLARRHPLVVAATLWRDYTRGRDDVSVVVARGLPDSREARA